MLTEDQLDELYDELGIPYSDEELELHSKNRTLKSELEVEHAYNYEAIMIAKMWLSFINGSGKEPTICIWRIIRPGKNLSNDRCNRLKTIFEYFSAFEHGKCPRLPIIPYCSRSTATLLDQLDKIHSSSRLDDAVEHFKNLLSLISNRGKPILSHDEFSAALHSEVDGFITSLDQYSHELGDYLRTFLKSPRSESSNTKLDTIITKLDKKAGKRDLKAAKREIINKLDGEIEKMDRRKQAKSVVRKAQIGEVKKILQKAIEKNITKSLHQACVEAWTNLKGGYPSAIALYAYCNSHKEEFPLLKNA